jgi:hypothetical protein
MPAVATQPTLYLSSSYYIDFDHPRVAQKAQQLASEHHHELGFS